MEGGLIFMTRGGIGLRAGLMKIGPFGHSRRARGFDSS